MYQFLVEHDKEKNVIFCKFCQKLPRLSLGLGFCNGAVLLTDTLERYLSMKRLRYRIPIGVISYNAQLNLIFSAKYFNALY